MRGGSTLGALLFLGCSRDPTPSPLVVRAADKLLLVSPSGYQTVSKLDGGKTGLYYDVAEDLLRGQPRIERVALLGLGGGEMLKAAHRAQPNAQLVGVEIDEHTAQLAKSAFGVPGEVVVADALTWIAGQPPGSLSVVMVDLYDDSHIVEASTKTKFLYDCACAVRPFGLFIMNVWPAERADGIEAGLSPYFETERSLVGDNVVITGVRHPGGPL